MAIAAGHLNAEFSGAATLFGFKESAAALAVDGFDCQKNWNDQQLRLVKYGRGVMSGDWAQPPLYDSRYELAIIADARLHDRDNLIAALDLAIADQPTDLTLILAAYRKWGRDCPKHLNGDYAFAIWDPAKQTLFCARDHIGAKPFYYAKRGSELAFATDLGAVLDAAREPFPLDEEWVATALTHWREIDLSRTFFSGVKALPPGHSLTCVGLGEPQLVRYWRPEEVAPLVLDSDQAYADAMREAVDRAVGDCLYSPLADAKDGHASGLGMHVSGGLDSSAVAIMAMRRLEVAGEPKPEAFCWQPRPTAESQTSPEHQWLEAMVEQEGLTINYFEPDLERLYQLLISDTLRAPMEGTFAIETQVQAQAKAKGIGVILSGWGGDELASHNGRTYNSWLLKTGQWRKLARNLRDFKGPLHKRLLTHALLPSLPAGLSQWLLRRAGHGPDVERPSVDPLLHPSRTAPPKSNSSAATPSCAVRDMQMYLLNNGHLTERIESWAIHGRKQAIEYRYPLLDRRVIELALSMPADQFRRGKWKRFVFRNAMRDILPDTVVDNLSKYEIVRVNATSAANDAAYRRIAREVQDGTLTPQRGEYVDMDRLLPLLESDQKLKGRAIAQAIQVLTFE